MNFMGMFSFGKMFADMFRVQQNFYRQQVFQEPSTHTKIFTYWRDPVEDDKEVKANVPEKEIKVNVPPEEDEKPDEKRTPPSKPSEYMPPVGDIKVAGKITTRTEKAETQVGSKYSNEKSPIEVPWENLDSGYGLDTKAFQSYAKTPEFPFDVELNADKSRDINGRPGNSPAAAEDNIRAILNDSTKTDTEKIDAIIKRVEEAAVGGKLDPNTKTLLRTRLEASGDDVDKINSAIMATVRRPIFTLTPKEGVDITKVKFGNSIITVEPSAIDADGKIKDSTQINMQTNPYENCRHNFDINAAVEKYFGDKTPEEKNDLYNQILMMLVKQDAVANGVAPAAVEKWTTFKEAENTYEISNANGREMKLPTTNAQLDIGGVKITVPLNDPPANHYTIYGRGGGESAAVSDGPVDIKNIVIEEIQVPVYEGHVTITTGEGDDAIETALSINLVVSDESTLESMHNTIKDNVDKLLDDYIINDFLKQEGNEKATNEDIQAAKIEYFKGLNLASMFQLASLAVDAGYSMV